MYQYPGMKDYIPDNSGGQGEPKKVDLPYGVEMLEFANLLEITLHWDNVVGSSTFRFITFFNIFWNAMVALFVVVIIIAGEWEALLFMSIFIIVGSGLMYYQITQLWNRTSIIVKQGHINIQHGPVPVPYKKSVHLSVDDIKQMYVAEYEFGTMNGVPQMACKLILVTKEGREHTLLSGQEREPLHFIERQIEQYLGIPDQRVDGEMIV